MDISLAQGEKEGYRDHRSAEQEVAPTSEYLTYDTQLPVPCRGHGADDSVVLPEEPNLRRYENPFDWSKGRKRALIWISSIGTTSTSYTAGW